MSTDTPQPHSRDFHAVADLINSKADIRLATMIGFGYMENYLGALLRLHLRDMPEPAKNFILGKRVRSFKERVTLAEAMGTLAPAVAAELITFADIRHRFAHHILALDCSDPEISRLIDKLALTNEALADFDGPPLTPDDRLRLMIAGTVTKLHDLIERPYTADDPLTKM